MNKKLSDVAAGLGKQPELAEQLDRLLKNPSDRAYLFCSYDDCGNNSGGRCSIFTVTDPPPGAGVGPCESYRQ